MPWTTLCSGCATAGNGRQKRDGSGQTLAAQTRLDLSNWGSDSIFIDRTLAEPLMRGTLMLRCPRAFESGATLAHRSRIVLARRTSPGRSPRGNEVFGGSQYWVKSKCFCFDAEPQRSQSRRGPLDQLQCHLRQTRNRAEVHRR